MLYYRSLESRIYEVEYTGNKYWRLVLNFYLNFRKILHMFLRLFLKINVILFIAEITLILTIKKFAYLKIMSVFKLGLFIF